MDNPTINEPKGITNRPKTLTKNFFQFRLPVFATNGILNIAHRNSKNIKQMAIVQIGYPIQIRNNETGNVANLVEFTTKEYCFILPIA